MKTTLSRAAAFASLVFAVLAAISSSAQQVDPSLSEALDSGLTFTSISSPAWIGQTQYSHDGVDAVMVTLSHGVGSPDSSIQTTVTGPVRVGFWWLCDSVDFFEAGLEVWVDNEVPFTAPHSVWASNYVDVPSGTHTIKWEAWKYYYDYADFVALLDEVSVTPLAGDAASLTDALDDPDLQWTGDFVRETDITHDGEDAAQSISNYGNTGLKPLETTIIGPALVQFYYKVDNHGVLDFDHQFGAYLDGAAAGLISLGDTDWAGDFVDVPYGQHVLSFPYDGPGNMWVDQLTVTPLSGEAPVIQSQSSDMTVDPGANISLNVTSDFDDFAAAYGDYTWSWSFNGSQFTTTTTNTLAFPAAPAFAGTYTVVVSNFFGAATSAPIVVTVNPPRGTLGAALDAPGLVWETEPPNSTNWFPEVHVTHDHRSAAQGVEGVNLKTTVIGPGTLTFWWKAGGFLELNERESDFSESTLATYDGSVEWRQATIGLTSGPHVLVWESDQFTIAWIDQVSFVPGPAPSLRIIEQPKSIAIDSSDTNIYTLSVKAVGPGPLSYQWTLNGFGLYASGSSIQVPSYNTVNESYGEYTVTVSCPTGSVDSQPATVSLKTDVGDAIGDPGTGWDPYFSSEDPAWFVATDVTFGRSKVLQSTPTPDNGSAAIDNSITGPGTLSFWWRTSSETNDGISFAINGVPQAFISGETRWQHYTYHFDFGEYLCIWTYAKDAALSAGKDCGFIADVQFLPDVAPTVRIVPHEQTVYEGSPAVFNTVCRGPKPAEYDWTLPAQYPTEGNQLNLPMVQTTDAGTYTVTASTDFAHGSDFAVLKVLPAITGRRVVAGNNFSLKVNYSGPKIDPFNWNQSGNPMTDGGRIRGSTTPVLQIFNAQVDDSGTYGVSVVSDALGYGMDVSASVVVVPPGALTAWGTEDYFGYEISWPSDITDVVAVATEQYRSAAVLGDSTVRVWSNTDGTPYFVPDDLTNVIAVALTSGETVALKKDGSVVTWPLDDGVPFDSGPNGQTIRAISASEMHVLYLDRSGTVTAIGDDSFGECDVPAGLRGVRGVAAGYAYSLAVLRSGQIVGWGNNDYGQITVPNLHDAIAVAAGDQHGLALRRNGTVVAWGNNLNGQTSVPRGLTNVVAIAAGARHSVALTAQGKVVTWGGDYSSINTASVPIGLRNVTQIAASASHTLAVKYAPDIISQPDPEPDEDPNSSTITVQASGRSPLSYIWRLNGNVVATTSESALQVRTPATWHVSRQMHYSVLVRNRYGSALSQQIMVPPLNGGDSGFDSGIGPVLPGAGVFDQMLTLPTTALPAPPMSAITASSGISISKQNDSIVLSWTASGAVFECADSIDGQFTTNVAGTVVTSGNTTSVTIPISGQQKFYRLRMP